MSSTETLRNEISTYLILSGELKAQYAEIDEETLADTLEGLSRLPDLLEAVTRSSLEDGVLAEALRARIGEMQERLSRIRTRQEKKRALVSWGMDKAGLKRLQAPDFTVSARASAPKLEISNEEKIPGEFFLPQPSKLDRTALAQALRRGEPIQGAYLAEGGPTISVRVK